MRIFDVSVRISPQTPVWPGDPPVQIERVASINKGDFANLTRLSLGAHTGTHVDAPYHFFEKGLKVDQLPLSILIGSAHVLEVHPKERTITATDLGSLGLPSTAQRLLIKTDNSYLWEGRLLEFERDFIHLSRDAARWIVKRGIKLIGVDYLSVDSFDSGDRAVHRTLLEAGVVIIEGLNLSHVAQGVYQLYCLPLKIVDSDGAPARVVLIK
ncbi:MAG TPA: cyclase family protein [Anaerolineae bacterium]|nr:cyclase family protein [Anaerolineae bacterium]